MAKNEVKFPGIMFTGDIHIAGDMFNIHDNQQVTIVTGESHLQAGSEDQGGEMDFDADLIEKLKPIFYNNEDDVRQFLKEISNMKPNAITGLVNKWVKEKRISDYRSSKKGDLWKILHDAKLYPRTVQNWNKRVY